MKQHEVELFPSGDSLSLAHTPITPAEFSARLGIAFSEGCDDLDYYSVAALKEPSLGQVVLLSYHRSPAPGTEILVDSLASASDALAKTLRFLGLNKRDLDWTTPLLSPSSVRSAS